MRPTLSLYFLATLLRNCKLKRVLSFYKLFKYLVETVDIYNRDEIRKSINVNGDNDKDINSHKILENIKHYYKVEKFQDDDILLQEYFKKLALRE
jgi:hypothetical protein